MESNLINRPIKILQLFTIIISFIFLVSACVTQTEGGLIEAEKVEKTEKAESSEQVSASVSAASRLGLDDPLPVDPAVRIGKLNNGLTYYIRANSRPEKRVELRLIVNVGSVLEEEREQGLAHYLEHLAFSKTEHFDKSQIVGYLESLGMRFGPDLNASTGFDRTLYRLQVPTDREGALETGLQILENWAHRIVFSLEEVERERGIIIEEWRLRRGADARIWDRQVPILFKDSRYGERAPIGKLEYIEQFQPEDFRRFYEKWYRPDLMAVIAVGDFDEAALEEMIRERFSDIKPAENPVERPQYPVPDHDQTLFAIASDSEATESRLSVMTKLDVEPFDTVGAYRNAIVEILYTMMFNDRLYEITKEPESPLLSGYSGKIRVVRTKELYVLGARVREDRFEQGLESLLIEAKRAREHGFTQTELERAKRELLAGIERVYKERDKTDSDKYVSEYVGNFLEDEPIPGIEYEYGLYARFVPEITLEEIDSFTARWAGEKNRVILASSPEQPGFKIPPQEELAAVYDLVAEKVVTAYEDDQSDAPLVVDPPRPGRIVAEKRVAALDLIEWKLSNGARVFLKPTEFKNNEVILGAYSPGGYSLVPDSRYIAARTAVSIAQESGLAQFDQIGLSKKLAGKTVEVTPFISEILEGISASSAPQDLETMFQLIYLYFTSPRMDSEAFLLYKSRLEDNLEKHEISPDEIFWDEVRSAIVQDHFRARPWTTEILPEMDMRASLDIFRARFADGGDFTYFIVGNFDPELIRPMVEIYLGGLPSNGVPEEWQNSGMDPPPGIVERSVKMGIEPKSRVQLSFNGNYTWSLEESFIMDPLAEILDMRLRETLREREGGTYDVGVFASPSHFPDEEYNIFIGFGCDPARADRLTDIVFEELERIKDEGFTEEEVAKVREILNRQRETNLTDNRFWVNVLRSYILNGLDPLRILDYPQLVSALTPASLKEAAVRYLDEERYVRVVLYPEGWDEGSD